MSKFLIGLVFTSITSFSVANAGVGGDFKPYPASEEGLKEFQECLEPRVLPEEREYQYEQAHERKYAAGVKAIALGRDYEGVMFFYQLDDIDRQVRKAKRKSSPTPDDFMEEKAQKLFDWTLDQIKLRTHGKTDVRKPARLLAIMPPQASLFHKLAVASSLYAELKKVPEKVLQDWLKQLPETIKVAFVMKSDQLRWVEFLYQYVFSNNWSYTADVAKTSVSAFNYGPIKKEGITHLVVHSSDEILEAIARDYQK